MKPDRAPAMSQIVSLKWQTEFFSHSRRSAQAWEPTGMREDFFTPEAAAAGSAGHKLLATLFPEALWRVRNTVYWWLGNSVDPALDLNSFWNCLKWSSCRRCSATHTLTAVACMHGRKSWVIYQLLSMMEERRYKIFQTSPKFFLNSPKTLYCKRYFE